MENIQDLEELKNLKINRTGNRKKFLIPGIIILLAMALLMYSGLQNATAYFFTVDELYARADEIGERNVRVSGMVVAESIDYDSQSLMLRFDIAGEGGQMLPVLFHGPQPDQMYQENAEAIIEGSFDGEVFSADTLLLKCPSKYEEGKVEEIEVEAIE